MSNQSKINDHGKGVGNYEKTISKPKEDNRETIGIPFEKVQQNHKETEGNHREIQLKQVENQ